MSSLAVVNSSSLSLSTLLNHFCTVYNECLIQNHIQIVVIFNNVWLLMQGKTSSSWYSGFFKTIFACWCWIVHIVHRHSFSFQLCLQYLYLSYERKQNFFAFFTFCPRSILTSFQSISFFKYFCSKALNISLSKYKSC